MRAAGWMLSAGLVLGAATAAPGTDAERAGKPPLDLGAAPRALASNGAIVVMPEIGGLSCRQMTEVLGLIDRSGYRGALPLPEGHPDGEIFAYEHRLAAAFFRECILTGHGLDDPGPAFSQGFKTP